MSLFAITSDKCAFNRRLLSSKHNKAVPHQQQWTTWTMA